MLHVKEMSIDVETPIERIDVIGNFGLPRHPPTIRESVCTINLSMIGSMEEVNKIREYISSCGHIFKIPDEDPDIMKQVNNLRSENAELRKKAEIYLKDPLRLLREKVNNFELR